MLPIFPVITGILFAVLPVVVLIYFHTKHPLSEECIYSFHTGPSMAIPIIAYYLILFILVLALRITSKITNTPSNPRVLFILFLIIFWPWFYFSKRIYLNNYVCVKPKGVLKKEGVFERKEVFIPWKNVKSIKVSLVSKPLRKRASWYFHYYVLSSKDKIDIAYTLNPFLSHFDKIKTYLFSKGKKACSFNIEKKALYLLSKSHYSKQVEKVLKETYKLCQQQK